MFFEHLNKREKILFYITVLFSAVVLLHIAVISPLLKKGDMLLRETAKKEVRCRRNFSIISSKQKIQEDFKMYTGIIKKTASDEEETASLLKQIESLAQKSKVSLSSIKPKRVTEVEFYKRYAVEIEGEGSLRQLVRFLYYIQNTDQILKAERLRVNVKSSSSSRLKYSVLITRILIL